MKNGLVWAGILGLLGASCAASNDGAGHPAGAAASALASTAPERTGWLSWRGPDQTGTSPETGLFDTLTLEGENHLWSYPIAGRGTPVIADGHVYAIGYEGEGAELEEVLLCLDEASGELLWEHRDADFLSDVIYSRYAIGSPTVDPETGNVFFLTGSGLLFAFTPDGEELWERSLVEDLGRLSFPNGRTGAPLVLGDLVITHFIYASWGPFGPARDRFFAFDKRTGEVVWGCTPGGPPKDSSFSFPVVEVRDGKTLMYAGLGGGHVACIDVRTGQPRWRYPFAFGGVNSSALLRGDELIVIHGKENRDSSEIGRMVSLHIDRAPDAEGVLGADAEVWRNGLVAFTSSPVLMGDRVYQTTLTGDLVCVDATNGHVLWEEKLAASQIHASPVGADGKLYVPMNNGSFYVIRPSDEGPEILDHEQLAGNCLGAPAVANGRVYVHTTDRLYCFGDGASRAPAWRPLPGQDPGPAGEPAALQLVPADASVRAGEEIRYEVRQLDANGVLAGTAQPGATSFELPAILTEGKPGVGVTKARLGELTGSARVRVVPRLPWSQDFDGIALGEAGDAPWSFPPGHWLGGRLKWQIVEREGTQVAARRIDNPLFQRTMTLIGHPDDANYTVEMDFLSDGNRRSMCAIGMVNQRYLIVAKGNYQELEVSSNVERIKQHVPLKMRPGTWYRMKSRVDVAEDGSGTVRAKVWPRDEAEPEGWTIEAVDPHAHRHGAFGVYAFTPQSRFTAYIDNLTVTPND